MTEVAKDHIQIDRQKRERQQAVVEQILDAWISQKPQAIIVEAPVGAGKTTIAMMLAERLQEKGIPTYFTTPAVQHSLFSKPVKDRTGVTYERIRNLPDGLKVVVVDEVSQRGPDEPYWRSLIQNDTLFLVLEHPNSKYRLAWEAMFNNNVVDISI